MMPSNFNYLMYICKTEASLFFFFVGCYDLIYHLHICSSTSVFAFFLFGTGDLWSFSWQYAFVCCDGCCYLLVYSLVSLLAFLLIMVLVFVGSVFILKKQTISSACGFSCIHLKDFRVVWKFARNKLREGNLWSSF